MATDGFPKMTASLSEGETDGLAHRFRLKSDTLVVVFSQVRVPAGKFGLERLFAGTTHSLLLVNEPVNEWYRTRAVAIDALIGEAASAAKATRLILYGSSMGAFGAASAAARHPDAELYAFAPDFRIGDPGSQSAAAGLAMQPDEADLGELLALPRQGEARVIVPLFDPYDAGVGARLADRLASDQVTLVPLRSSHEVHDHLYSLNIIRKVVATCRRNIADEAAARGLLVRSADWPAHARFAAARATFDAGGDLDPDDLLDLLPETNPGLTLLAAEAAERTGDIGRAAALLAELDATIASDTILSGLAKRYLKDVPRRRIRLLKEMGEITASRRVASEAAARFPTDERFAALAAGLD